MNPHTLTTGQCIEALQTNHQALNRVVAILSLLLLCEEGGVSERVYSALLALARKVNGELAERIARTVQVADGRWHYPTPPELGDFQ